MHTQITILIVQRSLFHAFTVSFIGSRKKMLAYMMVKEE